MKLRHDASVALTCWCAALAISNMASAQVVRTASLEEVVVTAQKRAESLQDTPIAISAFDSSAIESQGITSLSSLSEGASPYLRATNFSGSASTLNVAIRGIAPVDPAQATRELAVGVYVDDVYLGRAQGLSNDLIDLERIEVLRGPQGTLFGRNAVGGAVRFIAKKPTGELGIEQTFSAGNYGLFKSLTQLNLPDWNGLKVKAGFLYSDFDGWVDNPGAKKDIYNREAKGGRLTALWDASESFSAEYVFEKSKQEQTYGYAQFLGKNFSSPVNAHLNNFPVEEGRIKEARFPLTYPPGTSELEGHALTLTWDINDQLTVKSISTYREVTDDEFANFGGLFAYVPLSSALNAGPIDLMGTVSLNNVEQEQFTQEIQFLGQVNRLKYVVGLYYFDEDVKDARRNALFGNGLVPGAGFDPTNPSFSLQDVFALNPPVQLAPGSSVQASAKSKAIFAQGTWTPPVLNDKLDITVGMRYTEDDKDGSRNDGAIFDFSSSQFDPTVILNYKWTDQLSTYASWANAFLAGGANIRSASFRTYDTMEAESFEVGLKSQWWNDRVRLNAAIYKVDYDGFQIDFSTVIPSITETINSDSPYKVKGAELDLTLLVTDRLTLNYSHGWMDTEIDPSVNPFLSVTNVFHENFAPKNSGALSINYDVGSFSFGKLSAHLGYNWSNKFYTNTDPTPVGAPEFKPVADYHLLNGRLTLSEIPVGERGRIKLSLWGKNLTDDEYYVTRFVVVNGDVQVAFPGPPRTYGLDFTFTY